MSRLIGKNIVLREFRAEDITGMRGWVTDPEVSRHLSGTYIRPQTWEQTESFLHNMLHGDAGGVNFVIAERESLRYMGQCNLMMIDNLNHKAELAIVIGREHHGKGYGREAIGLLLDFAFNQYNLNRVFLKVHDDNTRAIRLYERCGFRHEGRLRQERFADGRYKDILVMGILRDEFNSPSQMI